MASVLLTQATRCIVDEEDLELLLQYPWYLTAQGYASTGRYPNNILMHRLLTNCPPGEVVDHIDGNKLNNSKSNLRVVSQRINLMLAPKSISSIRGTTSSYKGVSLDKRTGKYQVRCTDLEGRSHSGGSYLSETDAALAYNKLATKLRGEYAKLNEVENGKTI